MTADEIELRERRERIARAVLPTLLTNFSYDFAVKDSVKIADLLMTSLDSTPLRNYAALEAKYFELEMKLDAKEDEVTELRRRLKLFETSGGPQLD